MLKKGQILPSSSFKCDNGPPFIAEVTDLNPTMTYKDYLDALRGRENDPASLGTLLAPFKIDGVPKQEDEFLMVGHILDAIADGRGRNSVIDAAAVLEIALDLGMSA